MPHYAQISDGKVVAITQTAAPVESADMIEIDSYDLGKLGSTYADGVFIPAPIIPIVPTITSRQGKHALANAGLYHQALAAIAALPEPSRTRAQIDWEAYYWERYNATVIAMADTLGLGPAELDALFTAAAQIT